MRKILAYLWLPLVSLAVLALIYGGLTIFDLKNQNQNLNQKQSRLETKISQLEREFSNIKPVQVAGVKDEQPSATPTLQPTPAPTAMATSTPTATPTPTPTSTPNPTPTLTPTPVEQAAIIIESVGSYSVNLQENDTAFSILLRAGQENSFTVEYQIYEGMGAFVTCIAGICSHDNYYWAFYYNGNYSMVGASTQPVSAGDTTTWKFESF